MKARERDKEMFLEGRVSQGEKQSITHGDSVGRLDRCKSRGPNTISAGRENERSSSERKPTEGTRQSGEKEKEPHISPFVRRRQRIDVNFSASESNYHLLWPRERGREEKGGVE